MLKNTSLLISSCDKYSVCWTPFLHGLYKYWPNHPKDIFFITNYKKPSSGQAISIGEDQGWANNLLFALEKIDTPFILYSQEDYWINSYVNDANIEQYEELLKNNIADYIRLYPAPIPDKDFYGDKRLGIISTRSEYRTSLQMALWRKEVFKTLISPDESPWDFERNGGFRSQKYGDRFLSVRTKEDGIGYIFTAIINGEWTKAAYKYGLQESIQIDFKALPNKPFFIRVYSIAKRKLYLLYRFFKKKIKKNI